MKVCDLSEETKGAPKVLHIAIDKSLLPEERESITKKLSEVFGDDYKCIVTNDSAKVTVYDPVIFRNIENKLDSVLEHLVPKFIVNIDDSEEVEELEGLIRNSKFSRLSSFKRP